tara:strand:- start:10658 stop:11776 length:1119 start_codon:yes stop_codon:yes gene_type:complete
MSSELYIGLMSGTSMDAVDCVLADLTESSKVIDFINVEIPPELKKSLLNLCLENGENQIKELGEADAALGKLFASAALLMLEKHQLSKTQIQAIGSHGQTVRHQPPGQSAQPFSIQIGDPNTIAALTGITTVADFRRKDMALGGQGAPLLPAFHQQIFLSSDKDRIILNIGGMANITLLVKDSAQIIGFDTGPGNILLDLWIQENIGQDWDADGTWAASGSSNSELLEFMLEDPYFATPPPKSTGREHFNKAWLDAALANYAKEIAPQDVQATLVELSSHSIGQAIQSLIPGGEIIVCGGGAKNRQLIQGLSKQLTAFDISISTEHGINSDALEALAFAWFAKQTLQRKPIDLSDITGSSRPHILGGVYYAD